MSLSRPANFPLLKLPWLCIESVIRSWDIFDIVFFALVSQKTRRIVKHLKIPLNGIRIILSDKTWLWLCGLSKIWCFQKTSLESLFDQQLRNTPLMLRNNPIPLYTSRKDDHHLVSYTDGNEATALKMAMEFLNEVFKCSVEHVFIENSFFPESLGVKSTISLNIRFNNSLPFSKAQNLQLTLLLESLEVTGTCKLLLSNTEGGYYVNPKLFKCKKLEFCTGSAVWVTRDILLQFDVPRLKFHDCPFSVEDILSFITNWFHSDNKKLEFLYIGHQNKNISLEQLRGLNPVPFSERTRIPPSEPFTRIDFSEGLEIVRQDGLQATIHVKGRDFLFHIWHDQPAITQN
ncbi:unnamed protein product [Caenorhabditis brenneri]